MRVEYTVCESAGRWSVRRGGVTALTSDDFDTAVRAAENLARAAAERGEKGVVRFAGDDNRRDIRVFAPEGRSGQPRTAYDPEQDWRNVRHSQSG